MNFERNPLPTVVTSGVLAAAIYLLMPLLVHAGEAVEIKSETPGLDTSSPNNSQSAPEPSQSTKLYGKVRENRKLLDGLDAGQNPRQDLNATDSGADLQSAKASPAAEDIYTLAVKKLSSGGELSADEYRSLGVGCGGLEIYRTFFQNVGKVIEVYRDSPADRAGIRVGDKVIQDERDDEAKANPEQPLMELSLAKAGTPEYVTVQRDGVPVTITLIRINIEDIQEAKFRHKWETMIRNLGYPTEGTFIWPDHSKQKKSLFN
jgi:hypothetical protein